eukprot:jgi/Psemu1/282766/fgenesh1_pg.13_\
MSLLRFLFLALGLLSSSLALTVTEKKTSNGVANFTPIRFVFDSAGPTEAIDHDKDFYRGGRRAPMKMVGMPRASGCCGDYPFCSCPKIDMPPASKADLTVPVDDAPKASGCCADYPFCSCPKI